MVDGLLPDPAQALLIYEPSFLGLLNPSYPSVPGFCFLNPTRAVPRICAVGGAPSLEDKMQREEI